MEVFFNKLNRGRQESLLELWTAEEYVMLCRVVSCRVVSCRVVSCRVVSCRVVSCRAVP